MKATERYGLDMNILFIHHSDAFEDNEVLYSTVP
jgi:hypothetical protein